MHRQVKVLTGMCVFIIIVRIKIEGLLLEVRNHLDDGRRGERLRTGVHVTIIGPPNAGKSSLLNILCERCHLKKSTIIIPNFISLGQRPAAIVSPQAGTTRDVLESALDIFGYPIVIRLFIYNLYCDYYCTEVFSRVQ